MSKDNFQKLNHLIKQFYKQLRSPDFSFFIRIRRTKVKPCRVPFDEGLIILFLLKIIEYGVS